mmetsp:Transcript_4977/g.10017  ORF Transcript_4977/g.10017 Transcript_4977/m.10017 type:complete len:81 (-) Transcript_4977:859-1101(-)
MEEATHNSVADLGAEEGNNIILEDTDEAENAPNSSVFTSHVYSLTNATSLPIDQSDGIIEGTTHNSVADLGAGEERCRIF